MKKTTNEIFIERSVNITLIIKNTASKYIQIKHYSLISVERAGALKFFFSNIDLKKKEKKRLQQRSWNIIFKKLGLEGDDDFCLISFDNYPSIAFYLLIEKENT